MIALLPHCGFLSETSRMLRIGQALRALGEEVVYASHGGPYARVLQEAGVPFTLLPPVMNAERCRRFVGDIVQIGRPGVRLLSADEVRAGVAAEAAFLRESGARMAVIGFTLTTYLSSRVAGIPLAASHGGSYVPPVFERGLAPVPTAMPIPGTNWLPSGLKHRIANAGAERMTHPTKFLNEIAAELGVEPVPTLAALMLADLTLVTDVPEVLGIPAAELAAWRPRRPAAHRANTRLTYVGPLYAELDHLPVPREVEASLDGSARTAYVVLNSSSPQLLRDVASRVRAAGYRVIVGATIHDYGVNNDPGVVVAGLLPSHRIMPRVDLAVTMGGQGSVQTAMASGTPLIAIPLHPEQELNVALAVRQGMALAVAPREAGSGKMTELARRIAADARFKTAAERVKALYAGVDGAANSARAIVRYLERGTAAEARAAA